MRVDRHYCSALRVIRFVANENSSFHQTNSSAEFVCSRRSASRARCNVQCGTAAAVNNRATIHRRTSWRLAPRLALRASLRSFRRSFGYQRAVTIARAITQPAYYNYNEYSTWSGVPATNHTSS